jgi:uncharacterized coiled-coil protein SlyX
METLEQRLKKILGEQAFVIAALSAEVDASRNLVEKLQAEIAELKDKSGPASSSR